MTSSKARSLRERMSIDPDAPEPVARRRPRAAPQEATTEPVPDETAPPAQDAAQRAPEPVAAEAPAPEPDASQLPASAPPAPEPPASDPPAPSTPAAASAPSRPDAEPASAPAVRTPKRSPSKRSNGRRARNDVGWETALDDPAVSGGGNGYRSFYVSDEVFARFRAAVYWTARRPDADDVPDNMSVGVEDYMDQVATDLERRFNDRTTFPPTPEQLKAYRRREGR